MENKKSISKLFELYKEDIYKMDSSILQYFKESTRTRKHILSNFV